MSEFKPIIILRDGCKCRNCSIELINSRSLEVHHIVSRKEAPELIFDKENCITLCKKCHIDIHKKDKHRFS